ncbi:PadR family transcriptional regulator [Streptomyces endocoffeicus]|uniref:PadR family transcriptional regulator n=1 Tax=Streptomyces endocoffeicus TaxID=2898945 RepID=UPI0027DE13E2|nr:PadR family transcriptional regulator [Streptomyces endocoffeicus]
MRAVLPLCLLGALRYEESYGYALLQQLTAAGLESVKPATLYPALNRLAEDGAVEVHWRAGEGGPGRKCYRITQVGRERLDAEWSAWENFGASVSRLLTGPVPASSPPGATAPPGAPAAHPAPTAIPDAVGARPLGAGPHGSGPADMQPTDAQQPGVST